jgi:hypothetical protein
VRRRELDLALGQGDELLRRAVGDQAGAADDDEEQRARPFGLDGGGEQDGAAEQLVAAGAVRPRRDDGAVAVGEDRVLEGEGRVEMLTLE